MGTDFGNGLMSLGCMIMLIPILLVLIFVFLAVLGSMLGLG